jgi:NDP-sugar pyrophosphorylase family protein
MSEPTPNPAAIRLVAVTHFFPAHGGGLEKVAEELVNGLVERGYHVCWFSSDTDLAPAAVAGRINAGIYLLDAADFDSAPTHAFSLERDWFPGRLAAGQRFRVIDSPGPFLDIGTPETLRLAPEFVRALHQRGLVEDVT